MPRIACPPPEDLLRLAVGDAPAGEAEELAEHLAICSHCAGAFESLAFSDPLLGALRGQEFSAPDDSTPDDGCDLIGLIERIDGLARAGDSSTQRRAGTAPSKSPADESARIGDLLDPPQAPNELGRIGGHRVLDAIGQGGMGIVLRAENVALKRIVAIKLIRDARSFDPQFLSRFEQEGRSIARLHHPHIVQVHEVGHHRRRPYLVLEYVDGGSLADEIDGRPQATRGCAQLVAMLARAVQHAHEQGVVHRDLKPANVLLARGKTEAPGLAAFTPKIADFGLAKEVGEPGVTQTGELLGTPSYMAPELTRGHVTRKRSAGDIDERLADVYSLGAILFELLTGRPPFRGETTVDTFEQVRTLEPVPVRRLRPEAPRDLETICLKCLAKDPLKRYDSAHALADDLDRFIAGRPIEARPASAGERLAKWARRKPALATLAAVSAVAVCALAIGGAIYERKLKAALKTANDNASAARTAEGIAYANRDRAVANYREAREAMFQMLKLFEGRNAEDVPKLKELQRSQFEHALRYYSSVALREGSDHEARRDAAGAALEAGRLQERLGRNADAAANFEKAVAEFTALSEEIPDDAGLSLAQANALNSLAQRRRHDGNLDAAIELAERSLDVLRGSGAANSEELQSAFAEAHNSLGASYMDARFGPAGADKEDDDWRSAERHYVKAHEIIAAHVAAAPVDFQRRRALARCQINLSVVYQQRPERHEECEELHDLAEKTLISLVADDPLDAGSICSLALLRVNWSYVLLERDQVDEALADLALNLAALEKLLKQEPQMSYAKDLLYRTHGVRAQILDARGRFAESAADWKMVVDLSGDAERPRHRVFLALALAQTDRHSDAVAEAESTAEEDAVRNNAQYLWNLAKACSLAIASAEREGSPGDQIARYASVGATLLGQAKLAGDGALWAQLAKEFSSDPGFAALRRCLDPEQLSAIQ